MFVYLFLFSKSLSSKKILLNECSEFINSIIEFFKFSFVGTILLEDILNIL